MSNDRRSARLRHEHVAADITDLIATLDPLYALKIHTHAAADIVSGTMATARLGSGTASSATFLRGDQTWSSTLNSANGATTPALTLTATSGDAFVRATNVSGLQTKFGSGTGSGIIGTTTNHPLELFTNNTLRAYWNTTGTQYAINPSSGLAPAMVVQGNSTGVTNVAYVDFTESNGTVRGWIGDGSTSNNNFAVTATTNLSLRANGGEVMQLGDFGAFAVNYKLQSSGWAGNYYTGGLAVQLGVTSSRGYFHVWDQTANAYGPAYIVGTEVRLHAGTGAAVFDVALLDSGGGAESFHLQLRDITAGAFKRVYRGPVDSGGAGYRVVRILN